MIGDKVRKVPDLCTYVDDERNILVIEVILPDIDRDKIKIKIRDDMLLLVADGDEIIYSTCVPLKRQVITKRFKVHHERDMFRVTLPLV